ncbi:glycosyltransferase [Candidatus Saccharibacteria bacterium]|nr:glycosyltransferase [Candidatus Saccharibacteria bacterium]
MKVAIVCDWLTNVGGAERLLKSISELFPDAPIYTSQYNKKKIDWFNNSDVRVGWLQLFPSGFRRFLGPLRQSYFNHLDLSEYELIISVTGAEAKSIKKGNALHLCYCHVPTQYYWGLKNDYLKNPGFGILNPLARLGLKIFLKPLKNADYKAAQRPDAFITISTYAQEQIKKSYGRESTIIFPPVAVEKFSTRELSTSRNTIKSQKNQVQKTEQNKRNGFITTSRQVNWKRIDLAIEACEALKLPLIVVGEGPEHKKLVKLAKGSRLIKFVPLTDQKGLKKYLESAEGYIFPSLEPFGIAPVEALACGCPVIAYGNGGALDYVIDGENGILFGKQSVNSLRQALKRFKTIKFDEERIRKTALPFSENQFQDKFKTFVVEKVKEKKGIEPEKSQVKPSSLTNKPELTPTIISSQQKATPVKNNKTIKPRKNKSTSIPSPSIVTSPVPSYKKIIKQPKTKPAKPTNDSRPVRKSVVAPEVSTTFTFKPAVKKIDQSKNKPTNSIDLSSPVKKSKTRIEKRNLQLEKKHHLEAPKQPQEKSVAPSDDTPSESISINFSSSKTDDQKDKKPQKPQDNQNSQKEKETKKDEETTIQVSFK